MFHFVGEIPASKSILNRLLVIQSFAPGLKIRGDSRCDDVTAMRSALAQAISPDLSRGDAHCGAAGTTFRFLALRASRVPGRHILSGSPKLLARPHGPLLSLLGQLGVRANLSERGLEIEGEGWKKPAAPVQIDRTVSSQFASAAVLSAWNLDFDLEIKFKTATATETATASLDLSHNVSHYVSHYVSQGYLDMTLALVRQCGMAVQATRDRLLIPAGSRAREVEIRAESDLSSAFAVAALGALSGSAEIRNFPSQSLQPDSVFPDLLRQMGVQVERTADCLSVKHAGPLRAIRCDLGNAPDLFPVLSVLCAFAHGRSELFGAPHLAHKESSRIEESARLVGALGANVLVKSDGMVIDGFAELRSSAFTFDPRDDHRLAMAAAVAKSGGAKVEILHPEVVGKSFPEFWGICDLANLKI